MTAFGSYSSRPNCRVGIETIWSPAVQFEAVQSYLVIFSGSTHASNCSAVTNPSLSAASRKLRPS